MRNYLFVVLVLSPVGYAVNVKQKEKDKANFKRSCEGENMEETQVLEVIVRRERKNSRWAKVILTSDFDSFSKEINLDKYQTAKITLIITNDDKGILKVE
jgi:hypothetical protein